MTDTYMYTTDIDIQGGNKNTSPIYEPLAA